MNLNTSAPLPDVRFAAERCVCDKSSQLSAACAAFISLLAAFGLANRRASGQQLGVRIRDPRRFTDQFLTRAAIWHGCLLLLCFEQAIDPIRPRGLISGGFLNRETRRWTQPAHKNEDNASAPVLYIALEVSNKCWRPAFILPRRQDTQMFQDALYHLRIVDLRDDFHRPVTAHTA